MRLPRTPAGIYKDLNKRYFDGRLPHNVVFRFVEDKSLGWMMDSRQEEACVAYDENAQKWVVELNALFREQYHYLYQIIAHEAVHVLHPDAKHRSKVWNNEVRLLQGKGFFLRLF